MSDLNRVIQCLKNGKRFVLLTHLDPDPDGICTMLAFGRALESRHKNVEMVVGEPLTGPLGLLGAACRVGLPPDGLSGRDAVVAFDCSDFSRMSPPVENPGCPLINIDHHRSNSFFGDLNIVEPEASSTAEITWGLMKAMDLPVDEDTANHLFAGVQADTGSFVFSNTTTGCLRFAAEMVSLGAKPWDVWRRLQGSYGIGRLMLLRAALETVELHCNGKIGVITVTEDLLKRTGTSHRDCLQFVDFPRSMAGVEIAVMILEAGGDLLRFSLRSSGEADVACLAGLFGGGGHRAAAGFQMEGNMEALKSSVIQAAAHCLERDFSGAEQGC